MIKKTATSTVIQNECKAGLNIILSNVSILLNASLDNKGAFDVSANEPKLVESLIKARLIKYINEDENEAVVVDAVKNLLAHLVGSSVQAVSLGNLKELFDDIEFGAAEYKRIRSEAVGIDAAIKIEESDAIFLTLRSDVASLMSGISGMIEDFNRYLHTNFITVSDIKYRQAENKRAIKKARGLGEMLGALTHEKLSDVAGHFSELRHQLCINLHHKVRSSDFELEACLKLLNDNLAKIARKQDSDIVDLVDSFIRHYSENPTYTPSEEAFNNNVALCVRGVKPLNMTAYPPMQAMYLEEGINDIAIEVVEKELTKKNQLEVTERKSELREDLSNVVDGNTEATVYKTYSDTDIFLAVLFGGHIQSDIDKNGECDIKAVYEEHPVPDIPINIWIQLVIDKYLGTDKDLRDWTMILDTVRLSRVFPDTLTPINIRFINHKKGQSFITYNHSVNLDGNDLYYPTNWRSGKDSLPTKEV